MTMKDKYEKLMNKRVSLRQFVKICGGTLIAIAAIPLLSESVLAKVFLRKTDSTVLDIDTLVHHSFSAVIFKDTWAGDEVPIWQAPETKSITITKVIAAALGTGTPTVTFNIEERPVGTDITTAGVDIFSANQVADADGLTVTSFSNANIDSTDWLVFTGDSEGGTANAVIITVYYTID